MLTQFRHRMEFGVYYKKRAESAFNHMITEVQYHVSTKGSGKSLVLLHGFTGSSISWARHTAVLSSHFRIITIDLPGHGHTDSPSDPAGYHMEQTSADIINLLAELGVTQTALLGYSMGGRLALYIALHYPQLVQALILESASPGLATAVEQTERQQRDNALADRIERDGIASFVNFWEQLPLWESQQRLPQETRLALRRQRLQNNPIGLANSLRGMGTGAQPSLWPRLNELQIPVLLLAGAWDEKFVYINQQMAAHMPTARLKIVADAGHTIHWERPSLFNDLLIQFLNPSSRDFGE